MTSQTVRTAQGDWVAGPRPGGAATPDAPGMPGTPGARVAAAPAAGRTRGRDRTRLLALAALALTAIVVVASVGLATVGGRHAATTPASAPAAVGPGSSSPAADQTPAASPPPAADRWVAAAFPRTTPVLAAAADAAALRGLGFVHVTTASASTARPAPGTVIVDSPAARQAASPAIRALLAGAPAVAVFGPAADPLTVRVAGGPAAGDAAGPGAALARRAAGRDLVTNPRLAVAAAARSLLGAGGLDLRAETVLALLASRAATRLIAVVPDPPAQRAGLPARGIVVATTAAAIRSVRAELSPTFQPGRVQRQGDAWRWTWSVTAMRGTR